MQSIVNGFNMSYIDRGTGVALLLIHGYPLNKQLWEPQVMGLTARIITPDLRGFGASEPVEGPYSMDLLAQDCNALLDELGVDQPVVVGGLSMGGYVTFAFYRQFPERVRGLILASTRAAPDDETGKANRDKAIQTVREGGVEAIVESMLPKMMAPETYEHKPEVVSEARQIMESASVEGIIGALEGMKNRPDSRPLLEQITVPTLVIHGGEDQLVSRNEAEKMAGALQNARLEIVPEAGHLVNLERPTLFNQYVGAFLESF